MKITPGVRQRLHCDPQCLLYRQVVRLQSGGHRQYEQVLVSMLFHNSDSDMGSVIANGGVQLSNDESLIRAE